jgi:hypothetical protein
MALDRQEMMDKLEEKYPNLFMRTTEEFNGSKGGIWSSGENGDQAKDGRPLFNYYTENYNLYTSGVHKEIYDLLEENGWWAEWNDPGTIMFWEF